MATCHLSALTEKGAFVSIRSIIRAMSVLDCFRPDRRTLTLHEVSESLDLAKSTTFRILQTLTDADYLVQIDNTHYSLSLKALRLGSCVLPNLGVRDIARPEMEKIGTLTNETVALSEYLGDERIIIDVVESTLPLKLVLRVGEMVGHDVGATGQIFLAHHPESLEKFIAMHGHDRDEIVKSTERVLERGYAFTTDSRTKGSAGVAVPVFNAQNECQYSLGIYGPATRLTVNLDSSVEILKEAANRISSRLGSSVRLSGSLRPDAGEGDMPARPASEAECL